MRASELTADPRNWREHPKHQVAALRTVMEQIGFSGAVLAREDGGDLVVIDGHLRTDFAEDQMIPVLVLDVTEEEAAVLLATMDPIGAMAQANGDLLKDLVEEIDTSDAALSALLDTVMSVNPAAVPDAEDDGEPVKEKPDGEKKQKGTSDYVLVVFRLARDEYEEKMDLIAECVDMLGVTPHIEDTE